MLSPKKLRWYLPLLALVAVPDAQAQNPFRQLFPFRQSERREQPSRSRQESRPSRSQASSRSSGSSSSSSKPSSSQATATGSVITKPSVISTPGRYVLGSSLTANAGATTAAIVITASNVTLDMGGHTIRSRTSTSPDNCGVAVLSDSVRIRNGAISGFEGENQCGVLVAAGVTDFGIEDVRLSDCETGILLNPENDAARPVHTGRIARCSITSGSIGILAFPTVGLTIDSSTVSGCVPRRELEGEGSGAVLRGEAFTVRDSTFTSNTDGLRLEAGSSSLAGTVCSGNEKLGCFVAGSGILVRGSNFSANGGDGLLVAEGPVRIESSLAVGNGGNGVLLKAPESDGGESAGGSVLYQVTASRNGAAGISSQAGDCVLESCTALGNAGGPVVLQASDAYRNCVLPAAPQGGRDAGGNFLTAAGR